jgi:hypothetical protein
MAVHYSQSFVFMHVAKDFWSRGFLVTYMTDKFPRVFGKRGQVDPFQSFTSYKLKRVFVGRR